MGSYLRDNPPRQRQFRSPRRNKLTGCTVLHTAENPMDLGVVDRGAESIASFVCRRTDYGSYHDIVDSNSGIKLVDYSDEAYHDGTGSNRWSLSLSFACRTTDWKRMSDERRRAFLRQGAKAFLRQQEWRKANGHPTTELRRITRAESEQGKSGFIYHGERDPGRRSDPGVTRSAPFPFEEFVEVIREEMGEPPAAAAPVAPPAAVAKAVEVGLPPVGFRWDGGDDLTVALAKRRHGGVQKWQARMRDRGWVNSKGRPLDADGYFGEETERVVRLFQKAKGLKVDGRIGPNTWNAAWTEEVK